MAYYRGYYKGKKRYFKKYNKKKTKKFSKFNVYRHRSSKAQASQIYSLNKKVSGIYKVTKPKVHMFDSDNHVINEYVPSTQSTHDNIFSKGTQPILTEQNRYTQFPHYYNSGYVNLFNDIGGQMDTNMTHSATTTMDYYIKNLSGGTERIRLRNGTIYLSFDPTVYATPSKYTLPTDVQMENELAFIGHATLDLYVVQLKDGSINSLNDKVVPFFGRTITTTQSQSDADLNPQCLYSSLNPLNSAVWKYFRILRHKRIVVNGSTFKTHKVCKIKFTPYIKTLQTMKAYQDNVDMLNNKIYLYWRVVADVDNTDNVGITGTDEGSAAVYNTFAKWFTFPVNFKYRMYFTYVGVN